MHCSRLVFQSRNRGDSLDGLPPDLSHDGALSAQVLVAETQEIVDDKGCRKKTCINKSINNLSTFRSKNFMCVFAFLFAAVSLSFPLSNVIYFRLFGSFKNDLKLANMFYE